MSTLPHLIRVGTQADYAFAVSSWLDTMRFEAWSKYHDGGIFRGGQTRLAHKLLSMSDFLVAYAEDAPDVALGCLVGAKYDLEGGRTRYLLHWLAVPRNLWGMGIARSLFRAYFGERAAYDFVVCTQPTRLVADRKNPRGLYQVAQRYGVVFSVYPLLGIDFPFTERPPRREEFHDHG